MKIHTGLNCWRKLLSFSAMAAVMAAVLLVFGILLERPLQAQDPLWPTPNTPKLTFEVASIKLNKSSDPPHWNMPPGSGDFMRPVGGLFPDEQSAARAVHRVRLQADREHAVPDVGIAKLGF